MTRLLHPWFSLGFVVAFALQIVNWPAPMAWTSDDRRWLKHLKAYVTNAEPLETPYVGFFNAGQKLYFWAIVVSAVLFLVTGIPMWFPSDVRAAGGDHQLRAARRGRAHHAGRLHRSHL